MSGHAFEEDRPVTGSAFVNRSSEIADLTQLLVTGRNVLLVAPRRIGKTSLIEETFRRLPSRTLLPIYVDISKTGREHEVAAKILAGAVNAAYGKTRRGWDWVLEHFRRVRPTFSLHPLKGLTFGFDLADEGRKELEDVLELLEEIATRRRTRLVVAIDEFQNLLDRDADGETVGAMRGIIQHQRRVNYVFSGSKKHVLLGLVQDRNAPFWGQLKTIELGGIPVREFAQYARRQFSAGGGALADEVLQRIGERLRDNPRRIQECLAILHASQKRPRPADVDAAIDVMLHRHRLHFEDELEAIPQRHQRQLVLGLARETGPAAIYSKGFQQRHRLAGATFTKRAAEALRAKGILDDQNWFVDPLFAIHLADD